MQDDQQIKPDPVLQKQFNTMMVIFLAAAAGLFFWVEPMLFEAGIGPLLGDIYGVTAPHHVDFSITPDVAMRLAYQSDFYMSLFIGALIVAFFLPMGADRSVIVKRFLLDYSVKCKAEFYLPYASMLCFLFLAVWAAGQSFLDYELNSRIGFVDAVLTKVAPFMGVIAATMIAAILKGLLVFRLVLGELGAPPPDIANVSERYLMPWGLRRSLFKAVMARTNERIPDKGVFLDKPGFLSWGLGAGLPLLAFYNIASNESGAAPLPTALVWIVMGLVMLPVTRRMVFQATGQSISISTRISVMVALLLLSGSFPME